MLSFPGDKYVKNQTVTLYCGGVCWGEGNQGVARLVLTGCGIAVSEIFGAIREDLRCCILSLYLCAPKYVSLRPKSHLIAPYR